MALTIALNSQRKPTAKSLYESNTSIMLKIKGGARLCIEHDAGQLFKLYYGEADDSGEHNLYHVDNANFEMLQESLSILPGCLGSATIKTKIGDLHISDYRQAGRLRRWLASKRKK